MSSRKIAETPRRPIARWHGGKWRLAPWIIKHFPPHRIYVEPFAGAASVLLQKPRSYAEVLNDLDGEIVNVFRVLRDPERADTLRRAIELTPWARAEFLSSYDLAPDPVEQARRTIVRCFMAHGSTSRRKHYTGFRAKANRQNQTGAMDWINWPEQIPLFTARLKGVCVECRPAAEIIAQQDSTHTLFYLDPPYLHETRSAFRWDRDCYAAELSDEDHRALLELSRDARGMVIISGYPSTLYDTMLKDWRRVERVGLADGARPRTEVLWISPRAAKLIAQTSLFDVA